MASNPPRTGIQQQLIAPADLAGAVALQDGLHNLIQTPQFQQVMTQVIWSFFGMLAEREPSFMERVRRFIAAADRNDTRSYSVRTAANGGPIKVAERDETRLAIMFSNLGSATVYIGGRQVTVGGPNDASGGIPIPTNNYPPLLINDDVGEFWAISGTDAMDLRVLELVGGI